MNDLIISTGQSCKSTNWTKVGITWDDLLKRLSVPIRTAETREAYLRMKKPEQDKLKDVGGFVGGELNGKRRQARAVVNRCLVTLDLDNIPPGKTEEVAEKVADLGCRAAIYSTRKHCPEAPRLRVLIPLAAPVKPDEYAPISRKIAELIDISMCDPTTFEPERLMYWPSCCSDSEYVFKKYDGECADGSGILKLYGEGDAWKDATKWPKVPGADKQLRAKVDKAPDPRTKDGIVGAFCNEYSIREAMDTFLPGVYEPTDDDNRFTYTGGSTAGGALIYDDIFMYSHHASDPCCNTLVNAFDLVRLHKFSEEDADAKDDTPVNRMPSYTKMVELAKNDERVKAVIDKQRKDALDVLLAVEVKTDSQGSGEDDAWKNDIQYTEKGDIKNTPINAYLLATHDPKLAGVAIDTFSEEMVIKGGAPWDTEVKDIREWTNYDTPAFHVYMNKAFKLKGNQMLDDALLVMANARRFNPVADYLNALTWDGVKRIDTLFADYLGAEKDDYTKAVARITLCAGVARALSNGEPIKFDYMPILVGPQGIGKSTFIAKLGGKWYTDSITTFEGKDACEIIKNKWVCEVAELTAFNRSEIATIKQFLSKVDDRFRPAYARKADSYPRRCIFFGTSNDAEFLRDATGNRRFLPIDLNHGATKDVFKDLTQEVVDQIWAEAKCLYMLGEPLFLGKELEETAKEIQRDHTVVSDNEGIIERYLEMRVPKNWDSLSVYQQRSYFETGLIAGQAPEDDTLIPLEHVCAKEIWEVALNGSPSHDNPRTINDIRRILRNKSGEDGWVHTSQLNRSVRMGRYGTQRGLVRKN